MSNLREHHLNRKAESAALRYLAQKEFAKTSKADWIAIITLVWFTATTHLFTYYKPRGIK
jgi:predicted MFS family arabinose efflux permease